MTLTQDEAVSGTSRTLLGLISEHARSAAPQIKELVQLGAAAQDERRLQLGVSKVRGLTRTVALWAATRLDSSIAKTLEARGTSERKLFEDLKLKEVPEPAAVSDVVIHDDLARALHNYLAAESPRAIGLDDIAIAVLRDADANGGVLAARLAGADIAGAVTDLVQRRQSSGEAPSDTTPRPPPRHCETLGTGGR